MSISRRGRVNCVTLLFGVNAYIMGRSPIFRGNAFSIQVFHRINLRYIAHRFAPQQRLRLEPVAKGC
jgi:hypothetical protein